MKKFAAWMAGISMFIFVIAWGVVGLKIMDHNYEFQTELYIGIGALVTFFIAVIGVRL